MQIAGSSMSVDIDPGVYIMFAKSVFALRLLSNTRDKRKKNMASSIFESRRSPTVLPLITPDQH